MRTKLIGTLAIAGAMALAGCGGDDDEGDITAFCDKVNELRSAEDPFADVQGNDIDAAKDALEETQGLFAEVAAVAPSEIKEDVESAQSFFDDFVSATNDANTPQEFLEVATDLQADAEEFEATGQRLEQFTNENCGAPEGEDSGGSGSE